MRASSFLTSAIFGAALLAPAAGYAMTTQTFDFSPGNINARWEGKGPIQMEQTPSGILLRSTGTGIFITDDQLTVSPQFGSLTVSTEQPQNVYLTWIYHTDSEQINHSIPVFLRRGDSLQAFFSLSELRTWNANPKRIGIVLLPNTTIVLHQIQFNALTAPERLMELLRSFWTFDAYRTYSINFLWGPHLTDNPVLRQSLFSILPPPSSSAMYVLMMGLLLFMVIVLAWKKISGNDAGSQKIIVRGCWIIMILWIILDMRMGGEFLSSVATDHASYIAAPENTRTFRDRDRFYDFAAFAAPYVFDRESYVFLAEQQWPYLGNMRYLTYPAIPGIAFESDDTWVIYRRSDVAVNSAGQLTIEGTVVTGPGRILGRFDETSFVFRTLEKPTPSSAE